MNVRRSLRPIAGLLVLIVLTWAVKYFILSQYIQLETVRSVVRSMGPYGPLVFVGLCVAAVLFHLPEVVLIAIGSVLFGPVKGFALGWIGSTAGSTCSFLLARYFLREALQRTVASRFKRIQALNERLECRGFQTVLALRLMLFMAPPLNWAIGATRVRLRHYVLGSALGVVPCIAVTSYAADSIARAGSFSAAFTPGTLLQVFFVLGLTVLGSIAAFKFFR
jgi:phospholipase D1/2